MTNTNSKSSNRTFYAILIGCMLVAAAIGRITGQYLFCVTMGAAVGVAIASMNVTGQHRRRPPVANQH